MTSTTRHSRPPLTGLVLAAALLGGALLTGCAPAAAGPADATRDPDTAATTAAESDPTPTDAAAGTVPAGGSASVLAVESEGILDWQDRWYDHFCSSVVISLGDETCLGLAMEGVALALTAPDRIAASIPAGALGDALRASADEAAQAADAFVAAGCESAPSECIGETDDLTDAMRMYGDDVAEVVAAS